MAHDAKSKISVLAELERFQVPFRWKGDDEVAVRCPFHDDETPSVGLSVSKGQFKCHAAGCGVHGDIVTLLAGVVKRPRASLLEELSSRYDLRDARVVEPAAIERWHDAIWEAGALLGELRHRDVTDADIRRWRLGVKGNRVSIPVPGEYGDWVNVRQYLPGAPGAEKMRNMRGRGAARIYPEEQMRHDRVMLCGGEVKAIVAIRHLEPHNVGAVCITHGEKMAPAELLRRFAGKVVYVCMDVDNAGRQAALLLCRGLLPLASEVHLIDLPLDLTAHPKGDINDFSREGGLLWPLVEASEPWVPDIGEQLPDEEPTQIHLSLASNADHAGRRVAVEAIVTAMDTAPYSLPRTVVVKCDRSLKECQVCPVWPSPDSRFVVQPESPSLLEMVSQNKRAVHDALIGAVGVPRSCRVCSFQAEDYYNAEDVRLSPQLEVTNRASDQKMQPAVCIGRGLDLNEPYTMTGRMHPHPQTQQATLLISGYKPTRDALGSYEPGDLSPLDMFRPRELCEEAIEERLAELYSDLSGRVTHIYQRDDMHLAIDLAYHSPLFIAMGGRREKGWTEVLVVGDSGQGKSKAMETLMAHYQLGEKVECKNATVAGLLGGLQQTGGGRWFVTWGFIPRHDKRLVHLEELKGAHVDVLGKLTDMRSSGIAELPKIEKQRTYARTRIVATSNPRGEGRRVGSYGYGIDSLRELMGGLEDLRRFDMCAIVADGEIDTAEIKRRELLALSNGAPAVHTSELCHALVLWAWTRTVEQSVIPDDTARACLDEAQGLCDEFTDAIPVVDRGSMRLKVARLAASLAARTFSTSEDRLSLAVLPCHVRCIGRALRRIYRRPAFGYAEFTAAIRQTSSLVDPEDVRRRIANLPFPRDFVEGALRTDRIELQDIMDWCSWERDDATTLLSFLVRKHALRRDGKGYRKTGPFIELLRSFEPGDGRPPWLPEQEKF